MCIQLLRCTLKGKTYHLCVVETAVRRQCRGCMHSVLAQHCRQLHTAPPGVKAVFRIIHIIVERTQGICIGVQEIHGVVGQLSAWGMLWAGNGC